MEGYDVSKEGRIYARGYWSSRYALYEEQLMRSIALTANHKSVVSETYQKLAACGEAMRIFDDPSLNNATRMLALERLAQRPH